MKLNRHLMKKARKGDRYTLYLRSERRYGRLVENMRVQTRQMHIEAAKSLSRMAYE